MVNKKGNRGERNKYSDFVPVEKMHNEIIPEDFPEGPYGSPINRRLGKSTPFGPDQHAKSNFAYENKNLHEGLPRQYPVSHPPHDDEEVDSERPVY
ncbi:hypothetical protein [Pueribacillus sp. YX66]|uniref:hypothetical protein n=1 Tax=Pueribacillus sp. YX66 TaxID=3229242 RepID=UPI00358D7F0C